MNEFKNLGGTVQDHEFARLILAQLPEKYNSLKMQLAREAANRSGQHNLERVLKDVESAANALGEWRKKKQQPAKAFNSTTERDRRRNGNNRGNRSFKKIRCHNCNKFGHIARNCTNEPLCYKCNKTGHISTECNERESLKAHSWMCAKKVSEKTTNSVEFVFDSGSSVHIATAAEFLKKVHQGPELEVETVSGVVKTTTYGTFEGTLENGQKVVLEKVAVVPSCPANLISTDRMYENGYSVLFNDKVEVVNTETGEVVYTGSTRGRLRLAKFRKSKKDSESDTALVTNVCESTLWHWRLGHVNYQDLKRMALKRLVVGLPPSLVDKKEVCVGCVKGKLTHSIIPRATKVHRFKPLRVVEKLHLDTVGPLKRSYFGYKGFVLVTCDFTNYKWVVPIKKKDEVARKLIVLFTRLQRQLSTKIKVLHCDNGTEFNNRTLRNFTEQEGIVFEWSERGTPQQNGKAERSNREIVEKARCMLTRAR